MLFVNEIIMIFFTMAADRYNNRIQIIEQNHQESFVKRGCCKVRHNVMMNS